MSSERLQLVAVRENIAELKVDGRTVFVPFLVQGTRVSFKLDGETYTVETARGRQRTREHSMSAPMPGVVLKILTAADGGTYHAQADNRQVGVDYIADWISDTLP